MSSRPVEISLTCHPRESGDPGATSTSLALGPRFRGDDDLRKHRPHDLSAPEGRRGSRADRAAGFTLIEILVAFTIVALLLAALYQLFATGLRSSATAENYESAVLLAESGLDALNGTAIAVGDTSERLGRFERRTSVLARADLLSTEALSVPMLYELTVRVAWREGVRERVVTLSTLRAGPRDLPR